MTPHLRDYQLDVIERVRQRLREGARRVLIQGATGCGKTHVSSEIVRCAAAKGRRVLFLAHRRRLIAQKGERLRAFGVPHGIVMAGEAGWRGAQVQVASRDTLLSRSVRNGWQGLPPADLVIVDEAHNFGDQYQNLLSAYRDAVVVGMTATPADAKGRGLGRYYQALECTVPTSQLVREGWLVPVRCYAPERKGAKGGKRALRGDPVAHWKRLADGRPTVLFAPKVEASRAACAAFLAAGVPAAHIDAHSSDEERDEADAGLRAGAIKVVCNCNVWTEGTDIPELSCCVLLRLAGSYVLFAQAVGRIMRSHPGKKDAVLIDHSGAVYQHGFPDEDVSWELDEGDTVDRRVANDKADGKRKQPVTCPSCAMIFTGAAECPGCGHRLARRMLPASTQSEILVEARRMMSPEELAAEQAGYWRSCLYTMAAKGRTAGAAAHMYKSRFGDWPGDGLPDVPRGHQWKRAVADLYPHYARRLARAD
jgi:DNA repair protein RadD